MLDTPDLFSQPANVSAICSASSASQKALPYLLPRDLQAALKTLSDHELSLLGHALAEEQGRRHGASASSTEQSNKTVEVESSKTSRTASHHRKSSRVPPIEAIPLTKARINTVRAAFRAGIKPATIARQFGIKQAQVREALAGD